MCNLKPSCVLPVITERVSDGLTDELTVLLQRVEGILDRLVDGFLDGATHFLNLVHTATWLRREERRNSMSARTTNSLEWHWMQRANKRELVYKLKKLTNLVRIGDIDGGHVKATFVESWSLAELLDNLHHYSLRKWEVSQEERGRMSLPILSFWVISVTILCRSDR